MKKYNDFILNESVKHISPKITGRDVNNLELSLYVLKEYYEQNISTENKLLGLEHNIKYLESMIKKYNDIWLKTYGKSFQSGKI